MIKPRLNMRLSKKQTVVFEFGSAFTKVILNDKLIFHEPSLMIWQQSQEKVWALGAAAKQNQSKLSQEFQLISPIKRKAIANQEMFLVYLRSLLEFLDLKLAFTPWQRIQVKILVPAELPLVQQEIFKSSFKTVLPQAKFFSSRDVLAQSEVFAGGRRFGVDLGQTISFWAFASGSLVKLKHYYYGEVELDQLIRQAIETKTGCQLDEMTLVKLKHQLVDFRSKPSQKRLVASVKDQRTGLGKTVMLDASDLTEALSLWQAEFFELVEDFFNQLEGAIASDLVENGLILFGGLANLHGLAQGLTDHLGSQVKVVDKPDLFLVNLL